MSSFGKGSRGPRKKKTTKAAPSLKQQMQELRDKRAEKEVSEESTVEVLPADEDKTFHFKSKYKRDSVTLKKPTKTLNADGTRTIDPGKTAEFDYNSWSTKDPWEAAQLRQIIEERPDIGIVETTPE